MHLLKFSVMCLGALLSCIGLLGANASHAGEVLTVAAFPALDEIVKAAIPVWKQKHPEIDIKIVSRQFTDHHTAMTTALSTSVHLPDVMALEVGFLGKFAQGGGLENLSSPLYSLDTFKEKYVPYAFEQGRNKAGASVAAPIDIGPGTLLYRTDHLAKAGLSEIDLTRSWESYVQSGIKIKGATGAYLVAHAREIKDILIRSGLKSGEGLYFDQQSNVLVNSPRFVRAFQLAQEVRRHKLDAKVTAWSNEWAEGFRRGTLSTQLTGAWLAGHLNNWLAPQTRGKWRAANLPEGSGAAYGGTFLAIPRASQPQKKILAWEFIEMMTLRRDLQIQAFKGHDAFPALLEAMSDEFFDEPIEFLGGQKARMIWKEAALRSVAVAVHKQDAFADEVINTELDKVLDQGKNIQAALEDVELQRKVSHYLQPILSHRFLNNLA